MLPKVGRGGAGFGAAAGLCAAGGGKNMEGSGCAGAGVAALAPELAWDSDCGAGSCMHAQRESDVCAQPNPHSMTHDVLCIILMHQAHTANIALPSGTCYTIPGT